MDKKRTGRYEPQVCSHLPETDPLQVLRPRVPVVTGPEGSEDETSEDEVSRSDGGNGLPAELSVREAELLLEEGTEPEEKLLKARTVLLDQAAEKDGRVGARVTDHVFFTETEHWKASLRWMILTKEERAVWSRIIEEEERLAVPFAQLDLQGLGLERSFLNRVRCRDQLTQACSRAKELLPKVAIQFLKTEARLASGELLFEHSIMEKEELREAVTLNLGSRNWGGQLVGGDWITGLSSLEGGGWHECRTDCPDPNLFDDPFEPPPEAGQG